jgi:hypothetical protein
MFHLLHVCVLLNNIWGGGGGGLQPKLHIDNTLGNTHCEVRGLHFRFVMYLSLIYLTTLLISHYMTSDERIVSKCCTEVDMGGSGHRLIHGSTLPFA